MRIFSLSLMLLFSLILFAKSVIYKVYYGFFPAGKIEIDFYNDAVKVKGKSEGLVALFYRYKLFMDYNLKKPQKSILIEEENGKKKVYNFKRILKKKPWLPLVVNLLVKNTELSGKLKVGNYIVVLIKKEKGNYYFRVIGSKKTKEITLIDWYPPEFPQKIEIKTSKGTIYLEKIEENGL